MSRDVLLDKNDSPFLCDNAADPIDFPCATQCAKCREKECAAEQENKAGAASMGAGFKAPGEGRSLPNKPARCAPSAIEPSAYLVTLATDAGEVFFERRDAELWSAGDPTAKIIPLYRAAPSSTTQHCSKCGDDISFRLRCSTLGCPLHDQIPKVRKNEAQSEEGQTAKPEENRSVASLRGVPSEAHGRERLDALTAAPASETATGAWIPVEERMPKINEMVLCRLDRTVITKQTPGDVEIGIGYWSGYTAKESQRWNVCYARNYMYHGCIWDDAESIATWGRLTHWMPLPSSAARRLRETVR